MARVRDHRKRGELLVKRAKKLGLYDWLVERSARLCGTPHDVGKRMDELREHGVENWYLWPEGDGSIVECIDNLGTMIKR